MVSKQKPFLGPDGIDVVVPVSVEVPQSEGMPGRFPEGDRAEAGNVDVERLFTDNVVPSPDSLQ